VTPDRTQDILIHMRDR